MKTANFESRINRALGLINEMDRRDFIKKTSKAGIGLATGGSPLNMNMGADPLGLNQLDPFANLSDEELIMDVPIAKWLDKIPSDRLKRMINNDDYDLKEWWKSLLHHIMIYKPSEKVEQGALKTLKIMIDRYQKEDIGIDIEKLITKELSDPEGVSKIAGEFSKHNKKLNKNRYRSYDNFHLGPGKTAKTIKVLESIGIKIPDFVKATAARIEAKSLIDHKKRFDELENTEKAKKYREKPKREFKNYEPDLMHQPFESKLNRLLARILG